MDAVTRADTFFFVTTVAVVAVALIVVVALWYVIRILADIRGLSKKIKDEGSEVVEDVHSLRVTIKKEGKKTGDFLTRILGLQSNKKTKNKK
ncbi:MAG: hypothetical protein U1D31_01855 [Patescibacteria group bacterium]|nr:hypothetical protein [bacterium]MDZ4240850.1 hypothetical protein [Patescibacteria group bacterium]